MWSQARQVSAGDTVIIWLVSSFYSTYVIPHVPCQTRDLIQPLVVTPGKDFNTKFGNFRQADFVGVPYGSKVASRTGRGFLLILRPTPELWTLALPHRTQILYLADIAFITSYLNIKKGSRVIEAGTFSSCSLRPRVSSWSKRRMTVSSGLRDPFEFALFPRSKRTSFLTTPLHSWPYFNRCVPNGQIPAFPHYIRHKGTGSASFSHSVARTIGSSGHLWSYEFHEARFEKAKLAVLLPEKASSFVLPFFYREEFTRHAMDDIVTLQHRNVCKDGFTVISQADAGM